MIFFDPRIDTPPAPLTHNPFPALIAPRPIAWVGTIGLSGETNLAPYSHFNIVSVDPPMVMFAPSSKDAAETPKDTLRNVREVPEFTVSVVSRHHSELMNLTSKAFDYGTSEFASAGVPQTPSIKVRPPRVAAASAALECTVWDIVDLPGGKAKGRCHIVIGEVVGIHIAENVVVDGRVNAALLAQVARLGYFDYCAVTETFVMKRPA